MAAEVVVVAVAGSPDVLTCSGFRLPGVLSSTATEVDRTIAADDEMPAADVAGYLGVGESALKAIRLALIAGRVAQPSRILDFACGHGRVMRWLRAGFPEAELTGADVNVGGVEFCSRQFGARGVPMASDGSTSQFADRYDLIWVGSLFTHLPLDRFVSLLGLCHDLLSTDGVLVMTVHGDLVAERMRGGAHYGYSPESIQNALEAYELTGFSFVRDGSDGPPYGITLSSPPWLCGLIGRYGDLRIAMYTEALWANHQDVVAAVRRPLDPAIADRPYT